LTFLIHVLVYQGKDSTQELPLSQDLTSRTLPSQAAFSPLC
jgi:hypothetical protein